MILEDTVYENYRKEMFDYIDHNVLFRANPEIRYTEGISPGSLIGNAFIETNTYHFMMRRLTQNPRMLYCMSALMGDHIAGNLMESNEHPQFQFCGMEAGSIPMISALQMYFMTFGVEINSFIVRKKRKDRGLFHYIEGNPNNLPLVMIEDLVNSGTGISRAANVAMKELKLTKPMNCYSIIQMYEEARLMDFTNVPIFNSSEFSKKYDPAKYWLPKDCEKGPLL